MMEYYTLAYPYLLYCNEVWGSIQESKLQKLTIIQKKIIRMITNAHYLQHTNTMFDELGILSSWPASCMLHQLLNSLSSAQEEDLT